MEDGSMHTMASPLKAAHATTGKGPLTLAKPPEPKRGFPSTPWQAPVALSEAAPISGWSPNVASPATTEAHFGHDFSRLRLYADERADTPPGGRGGTETVASA